MSSYSISTILFNKGNKEFENENYVASLRYYFDSKRRDASTYYNISICYYNIGIDFYNYKIYPKALENFNNCLKYANDSSIKSKTQYYIKQCKAYNLFNDAGRNFDNKYYDDAIYYYSQAKDFFDIESMKNKCIENIGHCYYNKGNNLYKNANSELEYNNTIEMFKTAKSNYKNINDINNCEDRINECYAYIYKIYANREKNINYQLLYIDKAISFWPEQRYGKNQSILTDKGNFLIIKGNEEFQSNHYNNAKDYFTKSYEVFLSISNFKQCDNIKNGIERCDIYNKIESAKNELFYNNLQEAYNLFLEALDRAQKINDFWLKDEISSYIKYVKTKIDDLRLKKEREFQKKLELERIEKMNKLKKMQEKETQELEIRKKKQELLKKKSRRRNEGIRRKEKKRIRRIGKKKKRTRRKRGKRKKI